jgi:hypothetical protein
VTTLQVDVVDYIAIVAEINGMGTTTTAGLPNLSLADSALHAPFAGFGEREFYADFVDRPRYCSSGSRVTTHSPTETSVLPG